MLKDREQYQMHNSSWINKQLRLSYAMWHSRRLSEHEQWDFISRPYHCCAQGVSHRKKLSNLCQPPSGVVKLYIIVFYMVFNYARLEQFMISIIGKFEDENIRLRALLKTCTYITLTLHFIALDSYIEGLKQGCTMHKCTLKTSLFFYPKFKQLCIKNDCP